MIRVLIVDDSATARGLLAAIFAADPEFVVVGEAADGRAGVDLTRKLRPDVVTMDVRMPRMDGFEATKEIMIETPTPIVIITASRSARDVDASMNALRAGALAIIAKPAGPAAPGFDEEARQLLAQVKAMSHVKVVRHWRPARESARPAASAAPRHARMRVVAVAASTGGPAALAAVLTRLPADFPAPILVVQHITPGFVAGLAEWLNKAGPLRVKLAEAGEALKGRTVYFAPDDRHLGVSAAGRVVLADEPPVGGFRPSGTPLFEAVAKAFGPAAVAVILTGMGDDGVAGLRAVRQAGGHILAQDEKSSVIFGMPGAAVAAGLADAVLSVEEIASRLTEFVA